VPTAVVGSDAERAAGMLPDLFSVEETDESAGRARAEELLRDREVVVALVADGGESLALVDGSELFSARAALEAFTRAGQRGLSAPVRVLFNPELETSAIMVPGLAGLILLFVGTVTTSLGVVRERQAGTLEQLAVMPLRPRDVFIGKIAPYFLVASIDLAAIVAVGVLIFDVPFNGSLLTLSLGAVLFLFVTLGMGVLISGVSENQGQSIQLALMVLLPQVLLSGLIFPLESMPVGVRWIGYGLPLTYFIEISRGVMLRGAPLESVAEPMLFLALIGLVVFVLAVLRFRKDLAPAGRIRNGELAEAVAGR
jgi:ABC transporter DrrB family efflux protein